MVLLFMSISTLAFSQIAIGPKVGFNFANISVASDDFYSNVGTLTGSSIGAVLEIGTSDKFAIQPEIAFIQKGLTIDFEEFKTIQRFNYIEVTGLAKFKFGANGLSAYLAAGPSFGYALSASITDGETGEKEHFDFSEEHEFNRAEVSLALGGGLNVNLGNNTLFTDLRYLAGISNLIGSDDPEDPRATNQGLLLTVGILFNL